MVDQIKDDFLNFDKMTSGGIPVNISRIFNMADNQKTPESIIVEKFEVDLNKEYLIVDDDIASGKTIKLFKEKFPNIKIKGELSLAKLWYEHKFNKPYDIFDIVDLRDFIPHHKHGGLLVRNGKNIFRHPYIYPFVNLVTRMNMNPKDVMTFSKQIKEILY